MTIFPSPLKKKSLPHTPSKEKTNPPPGLLPPERGSNTSNKGWNPTGVIGRAEQAASAPGPEGPAAMPTALDVTGWKKHFRWNADTKSLEPFQPMRRQPLAATQARREAQAARKRDDTQSTKLVTGTAAVGPTQPAAVWLCQCGEHGRVVETTRLDAHLVRQRSCLACGTRWLSWEVRL